MKKNLKPDGFKTFQSGSSQEISVREQKYNENHRDQVRQRNK